MMFQQYIRQSTQEVHQVLDAAISELASVRQNVLTTDHILLGLISIQSSEGTRALMSLLPDGATGLSKLRNKIYDQQHPDQLIQKNQSLVATSEVEALFQQALKEAGLLGDAFIGTGALVLGLLHKSAGQVATLLKDAGLIADHVRQYILSQRSGQTLTTADAEGRQDVLEIFTRDLTQEARNHQLDPVVGREEELGRIIQTLSRRKKNNPVLIGQPGVGKTVIVEGLAQMIADARVPETLRGKRLLSLDMAEVIAGAKMRGEFEERLKGIRDAVIEARGQIILFIDELHTVVGAGSGGGGIDAPALLKSALAQGSLQVIGADTLAEYHQYVETDKALERRFQPIVVEEPSVEQTIEILQGVAPRYELHHEIQYLPEAIEAAARMSDRYLTDRQLPDKAVDLLDEAGARKHLYLLALTDPIAELERDRQKIESAKANAFKQQQFEQVADLQMKLLDVQNKISNEQNQQIQSRGAQDARVTEADVAEVVSRLTGIPVTRLAESESVKLSRMEEELHHRIIGQQYAVSAIANAIRRNRTGLTRHNRPIGSFLFLGPTGVGKTELARALAEFLLDDESKIIRIDMSEYMERHEVSKMIGAPPGYVGYGEGGQLTEKVRRSPYSVVLLDEIEKAHPDVFNILLQILEDGRLTDAQGQLVSFQNCLLIGTSNLGSDALISDRNPVGFIYSDTPDYESAQRTVMQEVKKFFKPEFLNRLDDVVVFHYLTQEHVRQIANKFIAQLQQQLQTQGITLEINPAVLDKLAKDGFNPVYGARPLRREIERQIEDPIASLMVQHQHEPGTRILVTLTESGIEFNAKQPD